MNELERDRLAELDINISCLAWNVSIYDTWIRLRHRKECIQARQETWYRLRVRGMSIRQIAIATRSDPNAVRRGIAKCQPRTTLVFLSENA